MKKRKTITIFGIVFIILACNLINFPPNSQNEDIDSSFRASVDANNTQIALKKATQFALQRFQPTATKSDFDVQPPTLSDIEIQLTSVSKTMEAQSNNVNPTPSYTGVPIITPISSPTNSPDNSNFTFRANENMFCRDGPATYYEAHTQVILGQVVPVLAKWINNNWLLVGIVDPPSPTQTKCCWIGGDGELNTNLSSIPSIDYRPDRIECRLYP